MGIHGYITVRRTAKYRASSTQERGKQGYHMDGERPLAQDEPNTTTVHAAVMQQQTRACSNLDCDVTRSSAHQQVYKLLRTPSVMQTQMQGGGVR